MKIIRLDIEKLKTMTDAEIREWLSNSTMTNAGYTTKVCRTCGSWNMDENGNAKTAEIVEVCRTCIKIPEKEIKS